MSALLECHGLECGYDAKRVLLGLDLVVRAGESVALLGPNGSGKSTLLKAIGKTLPIASGRIEIEGDDIRALSHLEVARRVAFVPQEEAAQFPFRVWDVVALGRLPHARGLWDSMEDRRITEEALRAADALQFKDRPITELSGGERQRVLIARALAQQAPLMLFDEPTSHLDVGHQLSAARLVRHIAAAGKGVLVAIHDLNLASAMATRAVLLVEGRVGLEGPVEEVLESPLLDEVYQVTFRRLSTPDGRRVVLPG